ncbi:MAG: hypothetical protein AB7T06_27560 [Kofleriaceae bacterium]
MNARRYEPFALLVLPIAWAIVVLSSTYTTDPDTYLHVGCARRLLTEGGCLRTFPWLPYTSLADPFANLYLGQHAALAPLASILPPQPAIAASVLLLSSAFAASLFLVLRRHGVARPTWWIVLGLLAVPQPLLYSIYLKGAATFLILLVWFVDAVWSGHARRVFVLAWLSVYVYIGATVLVPFVLVHLACTRAIEGRWPWRLLVATLAGLAAGMVVNLGWPAQWTHVVAELRTIVESDPRLVPGILRGAEWAPLGASLVATLVGPLLVAWAVLFVRRLASDGTALPVSVISTTVAAFGLLGAGMFAGTKMLELGCVFSLLALPRIAITFAWPRWLVAIVVAAGLALSARNVARVVDEMDTPGNAHPADYRELAAWLVERTDPGEVIVAPWDDMPGLFLFAEDQRYVAGWNVQFLRDGQRVQFEAYYALFTGQVRDPEKLLPQLFDGARFLIVRRTPRHQGEADLLAQLSSNPAFEAIASPVEIWRIFRVR